MSKAAFTYDAIVVGAGPNGLAAAITLQQHGLKVLVLEAKDTVGGGTRTQELTLPGFHHDVCSAIHPMAVMSPFFKSLPLKDFGLELIYPEVAAAHPFDDGSAAVLLHGLEETAHGLGIDATAYQKLVQPLVHDWSLLADEILSPLGFPRHPMKMARFGLSAMQSAASIAKRFRTREARGLWAGLAAHSMLPLTSMSSAAIALVLGAAGHIAGWPLVKNGSHQISNALSAYFISLGGEIETGVTVNNIDNLPASRVVLFDTSPKQLLSIAGIRFPARYAAQLRRYRYGPGVFKVDWALEGPVPFENEKCRKAGTVHLGNTFEEVAAAEALCWQGKTAEKPFVLLAQQSVFDDTRAPEGYHTVWGYCHVPNGSTADMTELIENQVERFAPGFKKRIVARHTMGPAAMQSYNQNYIGGDINGGAIDIRQLFTRPVTSLTPYRTAAAGIYICSASTPPGGGVHGMCGFNAARQVLKDLRIA
ncbi:NAD(P)/FAD-dependent oxidoreductase [Chitinophaga sp. Cy-1792]|uniref:phytoene desaturase family protein n=1 Tax=Chitinophaga sp. Cy-1792 TaxID=2608339 RepID=UPI001420EEB8|nr:NAD(P)/FAD-dependent oxidoreductase [Chitinophaga sp. Cy-1792]NIG55957.1 NAD(P)/FAD-dependent oxidoreductase [Chitinophaga sp. Cy-1792]